MKAPDVVVLGSLNVDYIAQVDRLPSPGQTVAASGLLRRFGGKGANQALAAARQGARVAMIGCVGDDVDGRSYLEHFRVNRIDVTGIRVVRRVTTGTALIAVDTEAENMIIVAPGANGRVTPTVVRVNRRRISAARLLMMQFEIPFPAITEAMRIAAKAGVPVVLNPSPLRDGFPWGRFPIDTLIVNEGEAAHLFGTVAKAALQKPALLRRQLDRWEIHRVAITRGARTTVAVDRDHAIEIPTLCVKPVDTVGAGDAFAGTLAARLAGGFDFATAVLHGNCAGALATLKPGAQESIPTRAGVLRTAASI